MSAYGEYKSGLIGRAEYEATFGIAERTTTTTTTTKPTSSPKQTLTGHCYTCGAETVSNVKWCTTWCYRNDNNDWDDDYDSEDEDE